VDGQLLAHLESFRAHRAFHAPRYLEARLQLLNDYFRDSGIRAAVVGVSGGIDSAVVLGLLVQAAALPGSPLKKVIAALIPMFVEAGASNQDIALARGREAAAAFGVEGSLVDLSASLSTMKQAVDAGYGRAGEPWAAGQLVSYLRTPALYYLTALLTEDDLLAALCGTTNRDEGAYIGFFGKASDGMVDLQPISDLHKNEVRQLAILLGVPQSILEATPCGDTYDGRHDELMIGAPYDFLELYQHWLCAGKPELQLSAGARAQWDTWSAALEELHGKNLHKYLASSVANHLDILERPVPGGWRSEVYPPWSFGPGPEGKLVGQFGLKCRPQQAAPQSFKSLLDFGLSCGTVDSLLSLEECSQLFDEVMGQRQIEVGLHGRPDEKNPGQGSGRASAYSVEWAECLWQRLAPVLPQIRVLDDLSSTDHAQHLVWRAVGVNPVLRFICYHEGGQLVPHYDAGFDFQDGRRFTLMSVVIYLNSLEPGQGGRTRFLHDPQRGFPVLQRNHQDWEGPAQERDILAAVTPEAGKALIFDHRLLHDGEAWLGQEPRLLLRTDVIFERCGLLPGVTPDPAPGHTAVSPKLQADPFYGPLVPRLGLEGVEEAGYFEDSRKTLDLDPRAQSDWLCTPLHKALARLPQAGDRPLAVLLTTGAFCPVHPGHIEMMEQAKLALERQGVSVLAGYLSPSHDEYVGPKCGPNAPNAPYRLQLCREAVASSPWLMVDDWESLHTSAALNFSDVIHRLTGYLNRHLRCARPIRVYYVFGSDNARFSLTFLERGQAICVERPGYREAFEKYSRLRDNPRVTFVAKANLPDLASSQIRNGDCQKLSPTVRGLWHDWRQKKLESQKTRLFLRDEGDWSLQHWPGCDLTHAYQRFMQGVGLALSQGFGESPLEISVLSLQEQRQQALQRAQGYPILSLDPCLPGAFNLGVSRCFELCSNQLRSGLVARPGWPPLQEQLESIPPGSYCLVDDDLATGHTLQEVLARLPAHCQIERQEVLCHLPRQLEDGRLDLGDFRDFLLGSWEGGLVVALPDGRLARVPYLLPYVDPAARLSLVPDQSLEFSRRVWQLNLEFFQDSGLSVQDCPPACRQLADYLGLSPSLSLVDWCGWHLARLDESR